MPILSCSQFGEGEEYELIGRESAALIESSLLSAALVPGRALHPMGGDAQTDFTELVKLLTATVSLLTALVGLSKALKQGSQPKKKGHRR